MALDAPTGVATFLGGGSIVAVGRISGCTPCLAITKVRQVEHDP
jgi:hypothetical protein